MSKTHDRSELASAAMVAIEPLIDFFLDIGINSPEAESLFRSAFVRRARDWLERYENKAPSDTQVAVVTGVHRNFVREILDDGLEGSLERRRRGLNVEKLLDGWRSDAGYIGPDGKPIPISVRGQEPSMRLLIKRYLPSAPLESTVTQMLRRGLVRMLPDGRIRLHAVSGRSSLSAVKVAQLGILGRDLLAALRRDLAKASVIPACRTYSITVPSSQAPAVENAMRMRVVAFMTQLGEEMAREVPSASRKSTRSRERGATKLGLAVVQTEVKED